MKTGKLIERHIPEICSSIIPLLLVLLASCTISTRVAHNEILISQHGDESIKNSNKLLEDVYVGVSSFCLDESTARAQAERSAREQIIQSIETRLSASMIDSLLIMNEGSDILSSDTWANRRLVTLAYNVISVRPSAFYVERWARQDNEYTKYHYIAWCSMKYSRDRHSWLLEEHVKGLESTVEELSQSLSLAKRNGRWQALIRQLAEIEHASQALRSTYSGFSAGQQDRLRLLSSSWKELLGRVSLEINAEPSGSSSIDHVLDQAVIQLAGKHLPFSILNDSRNGADLKLDLSPAFRLREITSGLVRAELSLELAIRASVSSETLWIERLTITEFGASKSAVERIIGNQLTAMNPKLQEAISKLVQHLGFQGGQDEEK